jgi:hypothetical protein
MSETLDPRGMTWTVAYRRPRASTFRRVVNWAGTWREAFEMADRLGEFDPKLDVWYVPSRDSELAGRVHLEDIGNILVPSGKRVRMTENGILPDVLLSPIEA